MILRYRAEDAWIDGVICRRENLAGEKSGKETQDQGSCNAGRKSGRDLFSQTVVFPCSEKGSDQDAGPESGPSQQHDEQGHQGISGADGCQRIRAKKTSDDDAVDCVVSKLQIVGKYERNCELDHGHQQSALCEIVNRGRVPFRRLHSRGLSLSDTPWFPDTYRVSS